MSHVPAAADTQVWMRTPSPGAAVVMSPLRRSRTAPCRSGATQPKQMPIRHPDGIRTPAASPASSSVWSPGVSRTVVGLGEGDGATLAGGHHGGPEPFGVQALGACRVVPVLLRGRRACRPVRTPRSRGRRDRRPGRPARWYSSMPSMSVCCSIKRIRPCAASMRSSAAKITSPEVGALCTTTTSSSRPPSCAACPSPG